MPPRDRSIFVEIDIRAPLERVWQLTQTPEEHERWDLRFTEIRYLPRPDESQPQRFEYATRIGLGLTIRGVGETVGERSNADGIHSSALKFWSDDPKSLIREGSGYWKYIPIADVDKPVTQFLTRYDYDVRFGVPGRCFDRLIFRPLIGWATAWSFDRLRLWIERDLHPAISMRLAIIHTLTRLGVAFVWLYHGLVPKLIVRNADEVAMLTDVGISHATASLGVIAAGTAEIAFSAFILARWRTRWPMWITLIVMPLALLGVALGSPRYLGTAFNVVTLNISTALLAAIALLTGDLVPRASRCRRRPAEVAP